MVLDDICDVLRDINENRLNKFELALSLVKLQERLLDDDIQYVEKHSLRAIQW